MMGAERKHSVWFLCGYLVARVFVSALPPIHTSIHTRVYKHKRIYTLRLHTESRTVPVFISHAHACCSMSDERKRKDDQVRETIMQRLVESGEKDR
jgi:hypothetical protein